MIAQGILEQKTDAFIDGIWYTISRNRMAYNSEGKRTSLENLAGQVTTTAWDGWPVTYNGENRPILWTLINSSTPSLISMSFDRMGRRVQYLEVSGSTTNANNTFTYDKYLCIARHRTLPDASTETDRFIWDPTEPIATRPLVFNYSTAPPVYYTHDGNKNVSELLNADKNISAHYEYTPFGVIIGYISENASENPWRFSSAYAEDDIGTVYYNYRHYEPMAGRWLSRDSISEQGGIALYVFCNNNCVTYNDYCGLYAGWDDALTLGIGALVGVIAQGVGDLVRGELSGWQDYLGSAVSGALFAEAVYLSPAMGPAAVMVAGAVSSGIGNLVSQGTKCASGAQGELDWCEFTVTVSTGMLIARIPAPRVNGVNAGRGSMLAVTRRISAQFSKGTISSMSMTTWEKAVFASSYAYGAMYEPLQNYTGQFIVNGSPAIGAWVYECFYFNLEIESKDGVYGYERMDWIVCPVIDSNTLPEEYPSNVNLSDGMTPYQE